MISYEVYKVAHLAAVLVLFSVLGGVLVHALNGGTRAANMARRAVAALHGLAMAVAIVAGFGLVARLDLMSGGVPPWVWAKVTIWLIAGLLLALPYRRPALARPILLVGLPFLAAAAAWLAVFKPGN
ncbi:MAG: hypothetical protein HOP28_13495 [Gemmatimonadales bacterium]|nr:hypothetical protein [Gemmatimonadales bacterium]